MLRASILFFFLGILSLALGLYSVAGMSLEIGRLLLFVFLGLSITTFLASIMTKRGVNRFFGAATISLLFLGSDFAAAPRAAHAADSVKRKMQDNRDDLDAGTQKLVRKAKRATRKATATDSAAEDARDAAADARDDARRDARKAKRKADSE